MAVEVHTLVFLVYASCSTGYNLCFGGIYCLYFQWRWNLLPQISVKIEPTATIFSKDGTVASLPAKVLIYNHHV